MGRSGCSGFSPAPLPLPQPGTASKARLGGENKTLGWSLLRPETCHTSCNDPAETSPATARDTARLSPGRAHAGGGAPEPGKILSETIPTPQVWPPGHRNKQAYLRVQSCSALEELMGIFPRGLAEDSRLCFCLGFFFNYYYFGKARNGFFGVGQNEGKELVQLRCTPAHFSWVWLLPTTSGVR